MPQPLQLDRRRLLKAAVCFTGAVAGRSVASLMVSSSLPPRAAGELDIHHIDTGRGNCTLIVAPDGTTLMVDAGASVGAEETSSFPRPNAMKRPGEWQARYAQRHAHADRLDYFLATHIHPDHVGDVDANNPPAPAGAYRLTGACDIDHLLPVTTHIDRSYPNYGDTPPATAPFATNYLAYLKHRTDTGRAVERATVGSARQIRLSNASRFPSCSVRILSADGRVWTGHSEDSQSLLSRMTAEDGVATENILSIALRLTYGQFSYYTGGDLNNDTYDGAQPWRDLETPVARLAGHTEVAAANHHGYFDACGPEFVHSLDAQAYIIQAWDIGHPGSAQMERMLGAWNGRATHDVFATDILPANALLNRRFVPQLKSRRGHVVVRVASGGNSYRIFILDSSTEEAPITATFGSYTCRA